MAELINLNRVRKARAKARAGETAAENRVRFGRAKADKAAETARSQLAARRLDGHRKADGDPEEG